VYCASDIHHEQRLGGQWKKRDRVSLGRAADEQDQPAHKEKGNDNSSPKENGLMIRRL
jgi:hypothetical protein